MKQRIVILILSCLLINCKQNDKRKPSPNDKPIQNFTSFRINGNKLIEYDLDTIANFKEVLKILDQIDCTREYAIFKLETKDKIYKIQPLQFCESIFDYKLKEIIYINTDSITVNYDLKFKIDSLKIILKNFLQNPNDNQNYPAKEEKKLICINVDSSKTIEDTKKLLLKIIKNINKLDDETNFYFMFENKGILPKRQL